MEHSLPIDIQQRIDAQLATGAFTTEVDVLRNALEALERRQTGLAQLRQMIAVAEDDVAANQVGPFDREATKQAIRDRFAQRGQSN
jgi:Arc/MetJ-type ribon-helix-helix transcriptional regulator